PHSPFYIPYHSDPPALHSFPTRRSSDLRGSEGVRREDHRLFQLLPSALGICQERDTAATRLRYPSLNYRFTFSPQICPVSSAVLDRKSTRLNSSHVSISYAVFCLKKKRI